MARAEPRHGDALAHASRRGRPRCARLPDDPRADHRVADRGGCRCHGSERHLRRLGHGQPVGVGRHCQCGRAPDRLRHVGRVPRRLGDRHVAVGEVRDRASRRHPHGRGADPLGRGVAVSLGGVRRHLHVRHHRRSDQAAPGTAGRHESGLRADVCGRRPGDGCGQGCHERGSRGRRGDRQAPGGGAPGHAGGGRSRRRSGPHGPGKAEVPDRRSRAGGLQGQPDRERRHRQDGRGVQGAHLHHRWPPAAPGRGGQGALPAGAGGAGALGPGAGGADRQVDPVAGRGPHAADHAAPTGCDRGVEADR